MLTCLICFRSFYTARDWLSALLFFNRRMTQSIWSSGQVGRILITHNSKTNGSNPEDVQGYRNPTSPIIFDRVKIQIRLAYDLGLGDAAPLPSSSQQIENNSYRISPCQRTTSRGSLREAKSFCAQNAIRQYLIQ